MLSKNTKSGQLSPYTPSARMRQLLLEFSRNSKSGEPIYTHDGKISGRLAAGTFYKVVQGSKHFLRIPLAIAIDKCIYESLRRKGCTRIEVLDKESGIIYATTLDNFSQYSVKLNRGWGDQLYLVLGRWQTTRQDAENAHQPDLFGG